MKKKFKLGVIGAGFMSSAIVNGAIGAGYLKNSEVIVSDPFDKARERMSAKGVSTTADNKEIFDNSEFVLFAVKPQSFAEAVNSVDKNGSYKIISIMAGVRTDKIRKIFPASAVARCMPNTPCSVGFGAVGIDASGLKNASDEEFVKGLFSSFAEVVSVREEALNVVTGVSGSAPAYFYLFLKGIIEAGVKHGLTEQEAKMLAVNTMIGSGMMVKNNKDKSLDELITAVCSKGGTTIEAINVYNEKGLSEITDEAVGACVKRAEELEKL